MIEGMRVVVGVEHETIVDVNADDQGLAPPPALECPPLLRVRVRHSFWVSERGDKYGRYLL